MAYIQKLITDKNLKHSYLKYCKNELLSSGKINGKDIVDLLEEFREKRLSEMKKSDK